MMKRGVKTGFASRGVGCRRLALVAGASAVILTMSGPGETETLGRASAPGISAPAPATAQLSGPPPITVPADPSDPRARSYVVTYLFESFSPASAAEDCPDGFAKSPDPQVVLARFPADERKAIIANQRKLFQLMTDRGPKGEDICQAPQLEPAATMPIGRTNRGVGLDLDGGKRPAGARSCGHSNLTASDGSTGIDNQLARIYACIQQRRTTGFIQGYETGLMRDGEFTILVQITDVDDDQNDADVKITFFAAGEAMMKDARGASILPDASFSAKNQPRYITTLAGRIAGGVLTTDAVPRLILPFNHHRREIEISDARLRLKLGDDRSLKGEIGGYLDWRKEYRRHAESGYSGERLSGEYTCSALYNRMREAADGDPDPRTGECNGISAAYTLQAIPAFILPRGAAPRAATGTGGQRQ